MFPEARRPPFPKNGKCRSFPKMPHPLPYVMSGNHFGKVKINGKPIRQSRQSTVWSTAQNRNSGGRVKFVSPGFWKIRCADCLRADFWNNFLLLLELFPFLFARESGIICGL
jgi:hypothetical protein